MGIPTVEMGGVFAPGTSPGTITVAGLNLLSGSTLQYELGAGNIRDRIVVTNNGNVTLGGLLDLSLLNGFNPALGQTFSLFEGSIGSITGTFSAVNAPIFNGHALNVSLRHESSVVGRRCRRLQRQRHRRRGRLRGLARYTGLDNGSPR